MFKTISIVSFNYVRQILIYVLWAIFVCSLSILLATKIEPLFILLGIFFFILGFLLSLVGNTSLIIGNAILLLIPIELQSYCMNISFLNRTGKVNFHILLFYFLGILMQKAPNVGHVILKFPYLKKVFALVLCSIILEVSLEVTGIRGSGISNYVFDVYITPFFLFCSTILTIRRGKDLHKVVDGLIFVLLLVGLLGIIEQITKDGIFLYKNAYIQGTDWYNHMLQSMEFTKSYRNTTTLGHFLVNATYFLFGSLLAIIRFINSRRIIYFFPLGVFLYNLIFTGSRAALFILVLCIGLIFFKYIQIRKRAFIIILAVLLLLGIALKEQIVYLFVLKPLNSSDGSLMVRILSIQMFFYGKVLFSLLGTGPYTATVIKNGDFLGSNFEIGWLISIIELGIPVFTLYFSSIVILIKHCFGGITKNIYLLPMVAIALMFATFNSFGDRSTINNVFWLSLSFMVVASLEDKLSVNKIHQTEANE